MMLVDGRGHQRVAINHQPRVLPAEALIKKKAKLDAVNKDNETPLHVAAAHAALPVLAALAKATGAALDNAAPGYGMRGMWELS